MAFATALLSAGAGIASSEAAGPSAAVSRVVALASAFGYLVAFLPPAFLRRLWQADAAYRAGQKLLAMPPSWSAGEMWSQFAKAARDVTGSDRALVLRDVPGDPGGSVRVIAVSGLEAEFTGFDRAELDSLLAAAGRGFERLGDQGPIRADLHRLTDARFLEAVELHADTEPGAEPERIVQVAWKHQGQEKHSARLRIETLDRVGLLNEIAAIFSERKTNIESANIRSVKNRTAIFDLVVDVADLGELASLIRIVERIPDVLTVERVGPGAGEGVMG